MKVLLVEDDERKRRQLEDYLNETCVGCEVEGVASLMGGIKRIRKSVPNLIFLDMTIPHFEPGPDETGGRTHDFGGKEFLRQLARREIKVPVIVVTQFPVFGKPGEELSLADLDKQLKESFSDNYLGAVYFNNAVQGWRDSLRDLISKALERNSV